jgi:omega-6 fatty acid desaturase (delta-12 desaturase)
MSNSLPRQPSDFWAGPEFRREVAKFEAPSVAYSAFQFASTVALFVAVLTAMYWLFPISMWLSWALVLPAGGLLVRIFIIQHDCGHGALFRSRRLNDIVGRICGLLTLTPYAHWRQQHAGHHNNWNNLDRRESGADIYSSCLTVAEYRALSPLRRFGYRAMRHPLVAHFLLPPAVFLFLYRVPFDTPRKRWRERRSVYATNLGILCLFGALSAVFGLERVLLIQIPVSMVASIVGVWLFALQHRFDGAAWTRQGQWNFTDAAVSGSSFLKLPRIFQWLTGNIGFHHIHHLSPRIPNYRLEACHRSVSALHRVKVLDWREGLSATRLALWDESRRRLVRFSAARAASEVMETGAAA